MSEEIGCHPELINADLVARKAGYGLKVREIVFRGHLNFVARAPFIDVEDDKDCPSPRSRDKYSSSLHCHNEHDKDAAQKITGIW